MQTKKKTEEWGPGGRGDFDRPAPPALRPSQALLNPVALDFPSLDSPGAWLSAIGLECYQDNFSRFGLCTFSDVAQLSLE